MLIPTLELYFLMNKHSSNYGSLALFISNVNLVFYFIWAFFFFLVDFEYTFKPLD